MSISKYEIEGKPYRIDNETAIDAEFVSKFSGSRVLIIRQGKPYEILIKGNGRDNLDLSVNGNNLSVLLRDEKDIKKMLKSGDSFGGKTVKSLMPGKVVKIFVKVGQKVKKNEHLLIVEAMKMENELKAPASGTVKKINACEGKSIEANEPLIILE